MVKSCSRIREVLGFFLFYALLFPVELSYSDELPTGYHHLTYAEQIRNYRKIYDGLDPKTLNWSSTHIDGLFSILKNGFALVTDSIHSSRADELGQQAVLTDLKRLYNLAENLESSKQLSQDAFLAIHLFMAGIIDRYKGISQEKNLILKKFNQEELEKVLKSNDPTTITQKASFVHTIQGAPLVAIIYKGRTGILPSTFVAQLFDYDKPIGLALFDVASMPFINPSDKPAKPGSKKDPHYSKFNSTTKLLYHDLSHIREQAEKEDYLFNLYKIKWQDHLQSVNKIRNTLRSTRPNDHKILTNGLFILSHELANVVINALLPSQSPPPKFVDIIEVVKDSMKIYTPTTGRQTHLYLMDTLSGYKADHRDHEFILKDVKDQNGVGLLPSKEEWKKLNNEQKMKSVQDGYEKFWTLFLKIIQ
jgi:hypothetical protein